jgi:hypothetical protein
VKRFLRELLAKWGFHDIHRRGASHSGSSFAIVTAVPIGSPPPPPPVLRQLPLPNLELLADSRPADWIRTSITTFGKNVGSFLPGHCQAYARIFHPFRPGGRFPDVVPSWRELAEIAGCDIHDGGAAFEFAMDGVDQMQAPVGSAPLAVIESLIDHLATATTTADDCYYAVWEGWGDSIIHHTHPTTLHLPFRDYHLFSGPLQAATTDYSIYPMGEIQSASLWWPADHAWCVATEVDHAWTYVGGSRAVINAILADPRLESVERSSSDLW